MLISLFFGLCFPWGVVGCAEVGGLCEAFCWCGGCGMMEGRKGLYGEGCVCIVVGVVRVS